MEVTLGFISDYSIPDPFSSPPSDLNHHHHHALFSEPPPPTSHWLPSSSCSAHPQPQPSLKDTTTKQQLPHPTLEETDGFVAANTSITSPEPENSSQPSNKQLLEELIDAARIGEADPKQAVKSLIKLKESVSRRSSD